MRVLVGVMVAAAVGCGSADGGAGGMGGAGGGGDGGSGCDAGSGDCVFHIDFAGDLQGWSAGFSDYPAGMEAFYELDSGHRPLPAPLDSSRGGFYLSGINHSDDLFMYLRGPLAGLPARTSYSVELALEVASNAAAGCIGVGGAPGEGVTMKAGVVAIEPLPARLGHEVDKGNQTQPGRDALVLGDVAVPDSDCGQPVYGLKRYRSAPQPFSATSGDDGKLWAFAGSDSGFEGATALYYTSISVTLHRQ
jgi:hypothetical protein